MTPEEAIEALDKLTGRDPEMDHDDADGILLAVVPPEVCAAYFRLAARADWWATA